MLTYSFQCQHRALNASSKNKAPKNAFKLSIEDKEKEKEEHKDKDNVFGKQKVQGYQI